MKRRLFRCVLAVVTVVVSLTTLVFARSIMTNEYVAWLWAILAMVVFVNVSDDWEAKLFGDNRADQTENR